MAEANTTQPTASKQFDRVQAAIWRQDSQAGDTQHAFYTLTLSRSFRDDSGEWRRVHNFTARDLPHVVLAVEWAMRELLLKDE